MKGIKILAASVLIMLPAAVVSVVVSAAGLAVPHGYRATVIPAAPAEVRRIKPGNRVDMLVTITQSQAIGPTTATLFKNVLVLDLEYKGGVSNLALALNPNEAQYAILSLSDKCRVNFIIRAKGDQELHSMEMASFKRLFGPRGPETAPEEKYGIYVRPVPPGK